MPAARPSLPRELPELCVVLLIGLPGAGKSSYLRERGVRGLSTDELRALIWDDEHEQRLPELIFSALRHLLRARLQARRPRTFVDATNLSPHERGPLMAIAEQYGYPCCALYFDVPLDVCRRRNQQRGRQVADAALERLAAKLRPPTMSEGFSAVLRVDEQGRTTPFFGPN